MSWGEWGERPGRRSWFSASLGFEIGSFDTKVLSPGVSGPPYDALR